MDIVVTPNGNRAEMQVAGKLTVQTAPELEEAIGKLDQGVSNIDLDLAGMTYIASAGLRVLVAAEKLMVSRGGRMHLHNVCGEIMDVLDMTGLSAVFAIE